MSDFGGVMQFNQPVSVLVVIVNYCSGELTVNCLKSLQTQLTALPGVHAVVVDNQSPDGSASIISDAISCHGWQSWVTLLNSPQNGGYAYGNNYAIRQALASEYPPAYVWLLNPDTEVKPNALQVLYDFMQANPSCGIAGSSFENQDGSEWPIAFRFPSVWSELDRGARVGFVTRLLSKWIVSRTMSDQNEQVDWMAGASLIIRSQVFNDVGLMDENYFLYFEETDFCLQTKKAGWSIWYVPGSRVMHIAGQSTKLTMRNARAPRTPKYWFESRQYYFVKNHGQLYADMTGIAWLLGHLLFMLKNLLKRELDTEPPYMLQDFLTYGFRRVKKQPSKQY